MSCLEKNGKAMEENTIPTQPKQTTSERRGNEVRDAFDKISPEDKKRILLIVGSAFAIMLLLKIIKYVAL
jgi:hypothetical protein